MSTIANTLIIFRTNLHAKLPYKQSKNIIDQRDLVEGRDMILNMFLEIVIKIILNVRKSSKNSTENCHIFLSASSSINILHERATFIKMLTLILVQYH